MAFKRVRAKVDLDAIRHNYGAIRQTLPEKVKIMGIIKADAYGHGALPVAWELIYSAWLRFRKEFRCAKTAFKRRF